jgi:hypothetical protein
VTTPLSCKIRTTEFVKKCPIEPKSWNKFLYHMWLRANGWERSGHGYRKKCASGKVEETIKQLDDFGFQCNIIEVIK